ncbi:MAG TPA: hypothetical protein VIT45_12685 [Allosphingosinicella sp.]
MKATAALLLLMLGAAPAFAQDAPASGPDDVRVNQLVVYGDDPCPASTNDEITVCARKPDAERFRIPEVLRSDPNDPVNESWANRATEMQYVGRSGIGSCSTTGPGGMVGCYNDLVRQARAERAGRDSVNWNRLIEEARQERLSRIDAEAEAEEAASRPN